MGGITLVQDEPATAAALHAPARPAARLSPRRVRLVFFGLMLALLLAALEQMIVATALPKIVGELHGLDRMSWAITAYLLTATVGLPVYGKLGDLLRPQGRLPVRDRRLRRRLGTGRLVADHGRSSSPSAPSRASARAA